MTDMFHYVSLGDSIATGTLTPFSSTMSYVYYLKKKLAQAGCRLDVQNLASDGDTSQDLLRKLTHSGRFRTVIERADLITLSIGGNDLLRASSIPGFARIDVHIANRGTRNFIANWPQIVARIKEINSKAQIVVLSVYNPYNLTPYLGRNSACDRNLCERTEQFLLQINRAIAQHAENQYAIADVYAQFKRYAQGKMHRVTCMYPVSTLRNPHPTPQAQRMIADLISAEVNVEFPQCVDAGTDAPAPLQAVFHPYTNARQIGE